MSELRIDVADLLTHPGAHRTVHLEATMSGLGGRAARVDQPVVIDLALERVSDGVVARGTVTVHWDAECSHCLRELGADLELTVAELFERQNTHHGPGDGETYPFDGYFIDLEQLVRDAALLELPPAPTCTAVGGEPCAPPSGVRVALAYSEPDPVLFDPRWAALSQLDLTPNR